MASRMDRYYKSELVTNGRSTKNKSLYEQIENLDTYTNIEGVATIEKTNEIDISKVQEMLKNRENYKKQKQIHSILSKEVEEEQVTIEEKEEPRNYDIRDILIKVKETEPQDQDRYRALDDKQYRELKKINKKKNTYDIEKEEQEIKELINTISHSKLLGDINKENKIDNVENPDDVGLLDELKSDTMVGDASSIKKILEDAKEPTFKEDTTELDKSFYTSSFGFTQSDFEELKNMNHKIKKGNKFIIVLLIVLITLISLGIIYFGINKAI